MLIEEQENDKYRSKKKNIFMRRERALIFTISWQPGKEGDPKEGPLQSKVTGLRRVRWDPW